MGSLIEWTDETWNPAVGCERVSSGCDNCYAVRVAHREMQPAHVGLTGYDDSGERRPGPFWTGEVRLLPERLEEPLRWRKPRGVFVGSMTDLFHPAVPDDFIAHVFQIMEEAQRHTFQVLTKRPQRMAAWLNDRLGGYARKFDDCPTEEMRNSPAAQWARGRARDGIPNVWLGTSVENQRYADLRIPHLLATPAAVRFLSIEPLLGPIDLRTWLDPIPIAGEVPPRPRIDWVIVGGESGPAARPMHPQWVRDLRDQCVAAGVPFFFKQAGSLLAREWGCSDSKGHKPDEWPEEFRIREFPNGV